MLEWDQFSRQQPHNVDGPRATRAIDRSTDRFDPIPHVGHGPQQALTKPTGYYASLGGKTKRGFGNPPGDARDRPIDRSIRFNTPLRAWSSTGSNVAYRLLHQPKGHNKARIRKASGRRARSPDRPIGRSTNRSTDRSIRFNASLWVRFSTGSNVAYRPAKGAQQSEDSERLRSPQISDAAL